MHSVDGVRHQQSPREPRGESEREALQARTHGEPSHARGKDRGERGGEGEGEGGEGEGREWQREREGREGRWRRVEGGETGEEKKKDPQIDGWRERNEREIDR